jgi:hypothetical protein
VSDWIRCIDKLPPVSQVVDTKIDDADGCRNVQPLKLIAGGGRLWFFPDGGMYVYYEPTHWRARAAGGGE